MMRTCQKHKAFTLIELLVVISIIAVLISLLLPAMKEARRQVRVVRCSSNLHQMGIGLAVYVTDEGEYPTPQAINPGYVWLNVYPIDNRENLKRIANGKGAEIYFCPLTTNPVPNKPETWGMWNYTPHPSPYQDQFLTHPDNQRHTVDYAMWFLVGGTGPPWDWKNSGNPDLDGNGKSDPPVRYGDSTAAVVADNNAANPPAWGDSLANPRFWSHSGWVEYAPFRETNVLYGDGHAETHGMPKHYVWREGGAPPAWGCY